MEFIGVVYLCLSSFVISFLIWLFFFSLVEKVPEQEKSTVYECGFDPYELAQIPFSVRFFLIGVLFIIFDLEIIFLIPWGVTYLNLGLFGNIIVLLFISFLIVGLVYEWRVGGLDWE